MAVSEKLQAIAATDLSGLQSRLQGIYDDIQRQTNAGELKTLPPVDETWVRKQLLPVLDKIARVKR